MSPNKLGLDFELDFQLPMRVRLAIKSKLKLVFSILYTLVVPNDKLEPKLGRIDDDTQRNVFEDFSRSSSQIFLIQNLEFHTDQKKKK